MLLIGVDNLAALNLWKSCKGGRVVKNYNIRILCKESILHFGV